MRGGERGGVGGKERKDAFPKPLSQNHGEHELFPPAGRGGAWALETGRPGFKPSCVVFCYITLDSCVTASPRFVFLLSNLELLETILYSSCKSLTRCCFTRTQLHPGHPGGSVDLGLSYVHDSKNPRPALVLLLPALPESKTVCFKNRGVIYLRKTHIPCTAGFLRMYTPG